MEVTTGGSQHDFDFTVEKHLGQLVGDGLGGGRGGLRGALVVKVSVLAWGRDF